MAYTPNIGMPPQYMQQPYNPNFNGDGWTGGGATNPFNTSSGGRDVYNMYQGIGQNQYQQSQDWQQQFGGLADYYQQGAGQYGQTVNDLYNPIWQGGGGYTPEMQGNILQSQGLQDIQGQLPGNYLTSQEQQGIAGNPYSAKDYFAGQAGSLSGMASDFGGDIRQQAAAGDVRGQAALGAMGSQYNDAIGNLNQGQGAAINTLGRGYEAAIDPSKLTMSSDYMPQMQATLGGAAAATGVAQADPGLNLTGEYRQQAGMTDQEVQDTASAAARGVGAQYQATKDQLDQDAAAAGTATPMGLAAARTALDRSSAAGQADALTNARLAARAQQRQAAQGIQSTALNAGQYRAGLGSSNALALEGNALNAQQGAEGMRIGAQQGLTGAQMSAAQGLAGMQYSGAGNLANAQMGAASNLGQAGLNQAQYITNAGMGASTQAGNWGLNTGQYNATMGTGLEQSGEAAAQARQAALAGNRQSTGQYNQQTGLGINSATSGRYQQAYQPWVSAQQEGRQAAQGQQQYYGGQANQQNQTRLAGWQTGAGTQLGAAQGYSGWGASGGKGFGDYLSQAVAGGIGQAIGGSPGAAANYFKPPPQHAHGGMIDRNQLIEVGEGDRPEVILPLDPATPPEHQNMWERMGSHLGKELGMTHGYRPNSASSGDSDIPGYAEGGVVGDTPQAVTGGWNPYQAPWTFGGGFGAAPPNPNANFGQNSMLANLPQAQPAANPNANFGQNSMMANLPQQPPPNPNANYGGNSMMAHLPQQPAPMQPSYGQSNQQQATPNLNAGYGAYQQQRQQQMPQYQPQFHQQQQPQYRQQQPQQPQQNYNQGYGSYGGGQRRQDYSQGMQEQIQPYNSPKQRQGGWMGGQQPQQQQPQGFARGGIVPKHLGPLKYHPLSGGYRMNIGKHNNPMPSPLSEMGSIGKPAYV